MTDRGRNIAVGLTALAAAIGLALLIILFGAAPVWLEEGYAVRVELPNAGGLNPGSRVTLSGIDVGRVTDVGLSPGNGVRVLTRVRPEVRIPAAARVGVHGPIFGGSPALAFDTTELAPEALTDMLPTDGSAKVSGENQTLGGQFQAALAEPVRQFQRLTDDFERLSAEWTRLAKNLNNLVEPRAPGDVDKGQQVGNLATALARADQRLAQMQSIMDSLEAWIDDPKLHEDVRRTVAGARVASEGLAGAVDKYGTLATRSIAVADDLAKSVAMMNQMLAQVRDGKGTAGKLLNDPELYNNLNDAAARMTAALDEFRRLMEKLQKEGVPVKF